MAKEDNKTVVAVRATVQYKAQSPDLDGGIPMDIPEKDKALLGAAESFGGKRGKDNFQPDTKQRYIEFVFPDTVKASGFRDIVKIMPGMTVLLPMVVKPGGGSKSGGSWH